MLLLINLANYSYSGEHIFAKEYSSWLPENEWRQIMNNRFNQLSANQANGAAAMIKNASTYSFQRNDK